MNARVSPFDHAARALVAAASRIGEAEAQTRALARTEPSLRWRSARLLWPLFSKG